MTRLYIMSGPHMGQSFELEGDTFCIGRAPENDIQIKDKFVSRKHIKILRKENKFYIEDLQSKNGTYLNGEQIPPGVETELREGLPIGLGMSVVCLGEECSKEIMAFLDAMDFSEEAFGRSLDSLEDRPMTVKKNMELIYNVSDTLTQAMGINEILERVLDRIFDLLQRIDRGAILLIDKETGALREVAARARNDLGGKRTHYSPEVVERVIRRRRAIVVSDSEQEGEDDLPETLKLLKIRSVMCVPMVSKDRTMGVIYVDSITRPYGFRKEDLQLLTALSSPVAMAIENAELSVGRVGMP
jgi:pSer/pThr/pTyr-binding forkhead associated (FHA) protein